VLSFNSLLITTKINKTTNINRRCHWHSVWIVKQPIIEVFCKLLNDIRTRDSFRNFFSPCLGEHDCSRSV